MRHLVKSILVVLVLGASLISCDRERISEEDNIYEVSTDSEKEHVNEEPDN
jgi:hypothetical protein